MKWIPCNQHLPGYAKELYQIHGKHIIRRIDNKSWVKEYFNLYGKDWGLENFEWLDEGTTVAPPVFDAVGVEEKLRNMDDKAMEDVIKAVSLIDLSDCHFQHGYEDHLKYVNALDSRNIVVDAMQFDGNLFWMMNNNGSFSQLNPMYKAYQAIAGANSIRQQGDGESEMERLYDWLMDENRKKAQTFFAASWLRNVAKEIEFRLFQSPSIPQAGFIEQLRASNPYTPARIGYKQRGAIWNECVDKAAEILGGKGEEGK